MRLFEQAYYLVIGPSWIGDMVMAQSLFLALKQRQPDCRIDVIAPAWSIPILKRMPEVNEAMDVGVQHGQFGLMQRWRLGKHLRQRGYSEAIVIPRSWKSALIPFFAGVPRRTGYRGEMRFGLLNNIHKLDKAILQQTVQRYVALSMNEPLQAAPVTPFPVLSVDQLNQSALLAKFQLAVDKPVLCIMPGAEYGPAKQWPLEHYAALSKKMIKLGWQVWILGSDKDFAAGEAITEACGDGKPVNLCGQTRLVDTIDILALADSVVSNDSGLMHVAAAVGVPVNVIYGSSTPNYTPPLVPAERAGIFYLGLECSPCFKRQCPLGHTNCLQQISAQQVYEHITH